MKLFSDAKQNTDEKAVSRQKKNTAQAIVIISPRRDILSEMGSQLLMHNLKNVVEIEEDFFALQDDSVTRGASAVIVDITDVTDIEAISETATLLIPASTRQIFVGNSDSIAFSQELTRISGGSYLHVDSQLAQLAEMVQETTPAVSNRTTMKISVLGCKGGVGTSTIAHQLFQATGMLTTIPTLLVQGASGSNDLDLLMARALPRDGSIFNTSSNRAVRIETLDGAWVYDDSHFNRFNLVFFDHGVYNQSHDRLEMIISQSHTILLVVSRELASVRMAKNVLDERKRIMLTKSSRDMRILVCLNENHPTNKNELRNDDIEEYLGCQITVTNNYKVNDGKVSTNSALYRFAAELLGKPVAEESQKRLFNLPLSLPSLRRRS